MQAPFTSIAVFGPGLLGGSIARAIREHMPTCDLRLWARREQPLELARQLGITDKTYTDPIAAARGAQLIILATPIAIFEDLSRRMLPAIDRSAIVTDIGSVKAYVHRTTGYTLTERGRIFIGSHPMAGTEKQGLEHSTATLLQGATVALTNPHKVADCHVERLAAFWQTLGCSTYLMDPTNHDQTVARISHMPHILAALCARGAVAGHTPMKDLQRLAASGFRDTTRVCEGPANMWADILWENDVAVRSVLADCIRDLHDLSDLLENQDKQGVLEWLEAAREARKTVRQS
ncbi:MAG: prephenate dehydrogenase/arogenate dehydrogenase family protein [Akkermansia sp.]|nr:prephenate dehydrogenase/arogenate dehydrogenase family protein [Akkermansia sp.]